MISSISNGISSLFYQLDTTSKGYLSKTDMESAFAQVSGSSDTESADSLFSTLDADSNGQLTQSEFSAGVEKLLSALDSQFYQMRAGEQGNRPPPPPPGNDEGFTRDELSEIAATTSDSKLASLMSTLEENFDAADTNGDGKITRDEAMSYQQAQGGGDATSVSTNTASTDAVSTLLKMIQMMQAYSTNDSEQNRYSLAVA